MMDRSLSFDSELLPKMKTLMILRVIVITTLLGGVIFFQMTVGQSPAILPVTILIATTYFLTIVYALSLYRVKQLRFFCYLQIGADLFIETGIIYTTGGVESIFSFLYILSIITASIVLQRRGSFAVASASSILYGTLANLELYRVVEPLSLYPRGIFPLEVEFSVFTILLHISAFFLVAFLSGYLSEKLKKTGEELKEKSGNLIELQAFHENIVQSLTSGLLTTDFGGKITSFNKAAEEITGYLLREVMEMPCSQLFPFLKSELVSDFSELTSSASRYEGRFQRKDGKECYLGMRVSPLRDELNDIRGLIYIFQDLTEIKEMEAQIRRAERLAAIGRIAAGIAHEIRNPLASMSGSIQVLKEELQLDGTNQQLMDIVIRETDRLNAIITDFLTYARPKPSNIQRCFVNEIVLDTVALLKHSKDYSPDISIVTSFSPASNDQPEGWIEVMIDPQEIRQLLWNLCINAVQAMPMGGTLTIETTYWQTRHLKGGLQIKPFQSQADSDRLDILVEDTGVGIAPEERDRIFDPFHTTKDDGTGLGLAIVYSIVEKYGGAIEVESHIGKGSAFRVMIPVAPPQSLARVGEAQS